MKRLPLVICVLIALSLMVSGSAFGWGSIAGTVYDESDSSPLPGLIVRAYDEPGGDVMGWAETDIYGRYTIYELNQGVYYVQADGGENCTSEWWENTTNPPEADPVNVYDGELTDGIDFGLACEAGPGCIIGTVYDENTGDPISGAIIKVYLDPDEPPIADAVTGELGHYEVCELDAGTYYVHAHAENCEGEWYNNKSSSEYADPVAVIGGEITEGIDFTLTCQGFGCIVGTVINESTGLPIHGAHIIVYSDPYGDPIEDANTNYNGIYEICGLAEGTYYVHANAEHCEGEWYDNKFDPGDADPVEVVADQITEDIDFALTCQGFGCIVGTVINEGTGLPIHGAHIIVYSDPYGDPIEDANTNHNGIYEICGLEEGTYYVHANAEHCEGEWYDNKFNPGDADPVEVVADQITEDIDFALTCEPEGGCIAGRVVDEDTGEPIREAWVGVYTDPFGDPVADVYTGEEGYYDICELEPGIYYAMSHAWECGHEWYNEKQSPGDADPIEVNPGRVTYGINFSLECEHPGAGCIVGRVVDELTGEPIAHALVRVYARRGQRPVDKAFTNDEGWYEICQLEPGVYYASAHARRCRREWYHEKSNHEDADPIEVHADEIVDGINFTLTCGHPGTGCIVGRVTDEEGHPIYHAFVAVVKYPEGRPIRYTFTNDDGLYEICQLEPGVYYAFAHSWGCEKEWYNNKHRADDADPIEVHAGEVVDHIDFSLECGGQNLCIWGRVVDEGTEEGIDGALVVAMKTDCSYARFTHTNDNGHYEICSLKPGEYVVFSHASGYIGEFYDNVYTWEEATPVAPPEDGIDFSLGEATQMDLRVSGRVFCRTGPASRAIVYAYASGNTVGEGVPMSSALAEIDGSYTIEGLPSGTYVITASRPGDPTTNYSELVTLSAGDVDGIDIYLDGTMVHRSTDEREHSSEPRLTAMPNPFRRVTLFSLDVPDEADVRLEVFDLSGRCVATLFNDRLVPGRYEIEWEADRIASGIYISRLVCGDRSVAEKIVLTR